MSLRDRELTNTCQTMHLSGILVTEQCRCFTITKWQITIAVLFCFVYIILEWTCHRTKSKYFFICSLHHLIRTFLLYSDPSVRKSYKDHSLPSAVSLYGHIHVLPLHLRSSAASSCMIITPFGIISGSPCPITSTVVNKFHLTAKFVMITSSLLPLSCVQMLF